MKIVLREPVPKLGEPGDLVSVAGGFARNYLIPRGMAVPATKGNLNQAQDWARSRQSRDARDLAAGWAAVRRNSTGQPAVNGRLSPCVSTGRGSKLPCLLSSVRGRMAVV